MVKRMVEKDFCDICDNEGYWFTCEECGNRVCKYCFYIVKIIRKYTNLMNEDLTKGVVNFNLCKDCYEKYEFTINKKEVSS